MTMLERKESPAKIPANRSRKPAAHWMPLDIAPLIAQRMSSRQPLPGEKPEEAGPDAQTTV
jgi:hypothetical protein